MKTTLRAKLLQHLAGKKKTDEGFTLIELLVVIIIIGILAAIALPSFLNQANKAKQTEAATNIGAVNRGQQAYRLENDYFSQNISGIGVGIRSVSDRYTFGSNVDYVAGDANETVGINDAGATAVDLATTTAARDKYAVGSIVYAGPDDDKALKGYTGVAYLLSDSTTGETTSTVLLVERNTAGLAPAVTIAMDANNLVDEITSSEGKIK
ncbi:type IV pilin-like G/H family protein [Leptothoe kymatousa]|uniref:Prepilin-type N-terminal cleavage/methylation domain-containing protein n=1 Tax=Leptothoe kymatousa TAU-MAC 1615 TaxID=2364775 RepID=A0ABS5Y0M6_9CYAN|nr:type IV pilin-like G/H family protein [Leptothoe kymatousa]MBT9311359.1 prepilin-type N-terminal cleavage/methylation domain-containing protein [Leptothoe kymatousa TAU-MAC 1615]